MQQLMKKHIIENPRAPDKINRRFLSELVNCLNELDPNLLESVNAQWEGFKKFSKVEGGEWKRCHLNGTDQVKSLMSFLPFTYHSNIFLIVICFKTYLNILCFSVA